jgi:hypothetical protein
MADGGATMMLFRQPRTKGENYANQTPCDAGTLRDNGKPEGWGAY